jgi:hypothetical protein
MLRKYGVRAIVVYIHVNIYKNIILNFG